MVEPGYRTLRIAPRPGGGITWAETSLDTPHGQVAVSWRVTPDGQLRVDATVPDGVTAEIDLPGTPVSRIGSGSHHLTGTVITAVDDLPRLNDSGDLAE